jgi:hypothetical protein
MIEDYDFVMEATNKYLDSMPPRSQVTLPDLVSSIKEMIEVYSPPPMQVSSKQIFMVAYDVALHRRDLAIMGEYMIYKHKND